MRLGKKKEKEIVKVETEEAEVKPPKPPEELKVKEEAKVLDEAVQETVAHLQQKFSGIYGTPPDHSVTQRDELLALTLALLNEQRDTNKILRQMLDSE